MSPETTAAQVLARIGRAGFPADLGPLAQLPDDASRDLLSTLVRTVLLMDAAAQATALTRLIRVVTAVNGSGRDIRAEPPEELLELAPPRFAFAGRLLPLIDTAQLEAVVAEAGLVGLTAAWNRALPLLRPVTTAPVGPQDALTSLVRELQPVEERPDRWDGPATAAEPPPLSRRTAHPRLEAADRVDPGTVFELRAGLGERPSPGVEQPGGSGLEVPVGSFTLTVKLLLDGFTILGSPSTIELIASEEDPYPYAVLRLRALDDPAYAARRKIVAAYLLGEQLLGLAFRWVSVGGPAAAAAARETGRAGRVWILDPDDTTQPDLHVQVVRGNNVTDPRLSWLFGSPHPQVPGSGGWIPHGTAEDAAEWSRVRFREVEARRGREGLPEFLRGMGKEVRKQIPPRLWEALRVAGTVTATPTVLLGTADPYLPWELALLPDDWGREFGEVLGGFAAIGRWIHPGDATAPAPAARIEAGRMAVVSGKYAKRRQLPEAEQEAADLVEKFAATPVEALNGDVLACLKAAPSYDILHFAVHGNFDVTGTANGILMVDGDYLSPTAVSGVPPSGIRLVFLNACQLGQAQSLLGEPAGMVPAFVDIGADAVIAPLWKVDDAVAREVAAGLYETLRGGGSPAEFLRVQRQQSVSRAGEPFGTRLAYLYFGHPRLAVTWH